MPIPTSRAALLLALLMLLIACGRPPSPPEAIRLVDHFDTAAVENSVTVTATEHTGPEWRFDDPDPALGEWQAGPGVVDLGLRDGLLQGRATSDSPMLHVALAELDVADYLHAVEIRMRVSEGTKLRVGISDMEELDLDFLAAMDRVAPSPLHTLIAPSSELRSYTLSSSTAISSEMLRHLVIRPTDAAGAEFAIASIRIIYRREYLAGIPSGVGWQGLDWAFRETLISRSPETLRFPVVLPAAARLDLAVGTPQGKSVTFRVDLHDAGGTATPLLARTLTRSNQWQPISVDLAAFGGQAVTLSLSLAAEDDGVLGFWGAPVVRSPWQAGGEDAQRPQGVIVIVTDTLRSDHLESYDYSRPTAPTLNRLAAEGIQFDDCIAQSPWTKPSVPSILSSLYPSTHGVQMMLDRLPSAAVTLSEVYRDAGYATLSLSSNFLTGKQSNLHQGFEVLYEQPAQWRAYMSKTSRDMMDRLLPWLEDHRDVPFFAFYHVTDPHMPYRPRPPWDMRWATTDGIAEHRELQRKIGAQPTPEQLEAANVTSEAFVRTDLDFYDASIRAMDAEIGRLLERLEELGLAQRTLVAVISDHGEEFLEHGGFFHGHHLYGEMVQVPLMLWGPRQLPAGRRIAETVQTIDLMPTLLELSGLPLPEPMEGQSLVPLLVPDGDGDRWQPLPAFAHQFTSQPGGIAHTPGIDGTESITIIADGWKLIHNRQRNPERDPGRPEYELYDHRQDPMDQHDVAADHPDVVATLAAKLESWYESTSGRRLPPEVMEDLSSDDLERLQALGYIVQ